MFNKKLSAPTFISKYKPYYIDDFRLDPDFKAVLQTLFDMDELNLLLIGAPNSGKTSFLYAMIREYYGLKRDDPISESNILFINNLKEQGIQFFRSEMKTFCRSHCGIYGKKKLIIIDDMDTINEQSQQVFRNYIDKYKHNVNFIAVCSNIQKIIESIQSRVNILQIPSLTEPQIRDIMENIVQKENIVIDEDSKNYLLKISGRSIRNVINNLEKIYIIAGPKQLHKGGDPFGVSNRSPTFVVSNFSDTKGVLKIYNPDAVFSAGKPVEFDICKKICSNISFIQFERYLEALFQGNLQGAILILLEIYEYGYSVIDILDYFFTFMKSTPMLSEEQKYQIIPIICKYITIFHNIHEESIELALFTNEVLQVTGNQGAPQG